MDKETFKKIQTVLEERVNACEKFFGCLVEEDSDSEVKPIKKFSVDELKALKEFADTEINIQTRILQSDLYHIIGMGNLSASQMGKLTKLVQAYCQYRPDLHAINNWTGNIFSLPEIPKRVRHKLHEFDVELIGGRAGEIEEDTEVTKVEVTEIKDVNPELVGTYNGKHVVLTLTQADTFAAWMSSKKSFNLKCDDLRKAIKSGSKYGGIQWILKDGGIIGAPLNESVRTNIVKMYNGLL